MASSAAAGESVRQALAEEERRGVRLSAAVRLAGLGCIAAWLLLENPFPLAWWYLGLAGVVAASGLVPLFATGPALRAWWPYVQVALDAAAVTVAALVPNPLDPSVMPAPLQLRLSNELFLFGLVGLAALGYSPRLVLWAGVAGAAAWSAGVLWVVSLPGTVTSFDLQEWGAMTTAERVQWLLDPARVLPGVWGRQVLLLVLVALTLSVAVARARRLVVRQVSLERERANLSRYFSPKLVDELARQGAAVATTRRRSVVVLFADLAGFTGLAAAASPDRVIELLREYHRRIGQEVFAHDGTLEEYLGDGIMATFGNPEPSTRDATNALACALGIAREMAGWNAERGRAGEPALHARVGLHYGPVVIGNVGDQQLQFAVVGDTVNVASRLQELGRELGASVVLSQDVVDAVRGEGQDDGSLLAGLREVGERELRGRSRPTRVWMLPHPAA